MRRNVTACLVATLLAACGQDAPRGHPLTGEGAPPPGSPPPAVAPTTPALPPGHPPMDGPVTPAPALGSKGAPQPASAFTWTAPSAWKASPPENAMRLAQYDLPNKSADGMSQRVAVFGPMGGTQANVDRWITQMRQPDGSSSKDHAKVTTEKREGFVLTRVEVRGIYAGMAGTGDAKPSAPGWTFIGAIAEVEGDPAKGLIVKLAGPSAVIDPEIPNVDALIASIKLR